MDHPRPTALARPVAPLTLVLTFVTALTVLVGVPAHADDATVAPSTTVTAEASYQESASSEASPTATPTPTSSADPGVVPSETATPSTPSSTPSSSVTATATPSIVPSVPETLDEELDAQTALAAGVVNLVPFTDVSPIKGTAGYSVFATEIAWMASTGISTGWILKDGSAAYRPLDSVTREQMAAFLHRFAGSPSSTSALSSPFTDVRASATFLAEIDWMWSTGLSRGWGTSTGVEFRPLTRITREQMAAFLYRAAGSPAVTLPSAPTFADVGKDATFAAEIEWLATTGISEGWTTASGVEYRPTTPISREAMAAFLYRMNAQGLLPIATVQPVLRHDTLNVYGATTLRLRSSPSLSAGVVTTVSRGAALIPTGKVDGAWIQVTRGTVTAWARSDYLRGWGGSAVTRVRTTYANGEIPASRLCTLSWDTREKLLCEAAFDLEMLNAQFRAKFGMDIPIGDSYRDKARQVLFKEIYGDLAAAPGTSNHGWGIAIDVTTSRLPGGSSGAAYAWLTQRLGVYNWVHPTWARADGSKPEPWHFEYTG